MESTSEDLISEVRGSVLWLTMNRPRALNALTFPMYDALERICRDTRADAGIRAMVLTGAGGRAFAAGTDIAQFAEIHTAEEALAYESRIDTVLDALEKCPLPTIAAVKGVCTGGGAAIASACDQRIASSDLRFGFPIARTLGNCLSTRNLARLKPTARRLASARANLHRPPYDSGGSAGHWARERGAA